MDFHPELNLHLNELTEALDDAGTDLQAILSVLVDDLASAIPSFLGLDLNLTVDGSLLSVTTMDVDDGAVVRSSLLLRLSDVGAADLDGVLICYAGTAGALTHLAADSRLAYNLDGQVVLDGHLQPAPSHRGIAGLTQLSAVNQAIGVLIDRHRLTVDEARTRLEVLADENGYPLHAAAQLVIDSIGRSVS